MKSLHATLGILSVLALTTISPNASATVYDLNYIASTSDDTTADGQITVVDGLATGGFLDVTAGPDEGTYTLVPGTGTDASFVYDNFVFPDSDSGFLDTTAGLLWSVSGAAGNSSEVNMWFNETAQYGAPGDTYSLWGAPGNWNLESYGSATLTEEFAPAEITHSQAIPDGGSTFALLTGGMGGMLALRRKLRR